MVGIHRWTLAGDREREHVFVGASVCFGTGVLFVLLALARGSAPARGLIGWLVGWVGCASSASPVT